MHPTENYEKNGTTTDEQSFDWFPGHTAMLSSPFGENCVVPKETAIATCDMIESVPDVVRLYNLFEGDAGAYADGHIYMGARRPKSFALSSSEQDSVVNWAKDQIGKPWNFVNSPDAQGSTEFSCVGLVESAYESIGKGLLSESGGIYSRYINAALPLSMYNQTKPVDEITEEPGNSISIRVNPVYAFITNRGTHAYDDYRNIGINTPQNFSFTATNLPTGATFDNMTGMFNWNNIPLSYANTSHTVIFEVKGDYETLFSTESKSVSQSLTIHIGGSTTPPVVQVCPEDYFSYYGTGTLDELLEMGNKDVGVSDGDKHQVKELQFFLEALDIDVGNNGTDGWFGGDTENAVKIFQKAKGLTQTGKIDADTQNIINASCHDKIH